MRSDREQREFVDFYLPFSGRLSRENRWVKLAEMVPWELVEQCYEQSLGKTAMGAPAKSGRIAYGALLIKERLGITDAETVEQVMENPYLQYFLGMSELQTKPIFHATMMVHFRSRFSTQHHEMINEKIIEAATRSATDGEDKTDDNDSNQDGHPNAGKLLVDATCTPADIRYPTDLSLLNEAREKSEAIIDQFHKEITQASASMKKKPRTYRKRARKQYLAVAKQKKPSAQKIRKVIGQQLNYLRRNLGHIKKMLGSHPEILSTLSRYDYKCLLVIGTLYEQQRYMHSQRVHVVADRIVSISQPHVRAIVRGKAGKKVEFGAKISISYQQEGYITLDTLSWDAYNESGDLPEQIEAYRRRLGYYPASVHADTIYRTRANRAYCKARGIRISGSPLGRPKKQTHENQSELKAQKRQEIQDQHERIPVEGKFGNAKRKGTLGRIMAKLAHTGESVIHIGIIVLNLDKWLRELIFWLLNLLKSFRLLPLVSSTRLLKPPRSTRSPSQHLLSA